MERNSYLENLFRLKENFSVKIISGVRGVGKSTLLKSFAERLRASGVAEREIIFIDCEADVQPKTFKELYTFVVEKTSELEKFFLLVDEPACVVECEKAINALFVGTPAEIYVADSSGTFAEKISSLLPENCDVLKIYPLSFAEYKKIFPSQDSETALENYLHFGSLPVTFDAEKNSLPKILRGAAYEILFDLVAKNYLQSAQRFQRIATTIVQNFDKRLSSNGLMNQTLPRETATNIRTGNLYMKVVAQIFLKAPLFDVRAGKVVVGGEYFFCVDNGLFRALRNFDDADEIALIEQAIFIELLRRGFEVCRGKSGAMNINFLARREDEKLAIQVLPPDGSISARRITRPLRELQTDGRKILIGTTREKISNDIEKITLLEFLSGV